MMDDVTAIGTLARAFCGVRRAQLHEALEQQGDGCLGAALVRVGALTQEQLATLLARQWALRNGLASLEDIARLVDFAARGSLTVTDRWADFMQSLSAQLSPQSA